MNASALRDSCKIGGRQFRLAPETDFVVHRQMQLVVEMALAVRDGDARVRIALIDCLAALVATVITWIEEGEARPARDSAKPTYS